MGLITEALLYNPGEIRTAGFEYRKSCSLAYFRKGLWQIGNSVPRLASVTNFHRKYFAEGSDGIAAVLAQAVWNSNTEDLCW